MSLTIPPKVATAIFITTGQHFPGVGETELRGAARGFKKGGQRLRGRLSTLVDLLSAISAKNLDGDFAAALLRQLRGCRAGFGMLASYADGAGDTIERIALAVEYFKINLIYEFIESLIDLALVLLFPATAPRLAARQAARVARLGVLRTVFLQVLRAALAEMGSETGADGVAQTIQEHWGHRTGHDWSLTADAAKGGLIAAGVVPLMGFLAGPARSLLGDLLRGAATEQVTDVAAALLLDGGDLSGVGLGGALSGAAERAGHRIARGGNTLLFGGGGPPVLDPPRDAGGPRDAPRGPAAPGVPVSRGAAQPFHPVPAPATPPGNPAGNPAPTPGSAGTARAVPAPPYLLEPGLIGGPSTPVEDYTGGESLRKEIHDALLRRHAGTSEELTSELNRQLSDDLLRSTGARRLFSGGLPVVLFPGGPHELDLTLTAPPPGAYTPVAAPEETGSSDHRLQTAHTRQHGTVDEGRHGFVTGAGYGGTGGSAPVDVKVATTGSVSVTASKITTTTSTVSSGVRNRQEVTRPRLGPGPTNAELLRGSTEISVTLRRRGAPPRRIARLGNQQITLRATRSVLTYRPVAAAQHRAERLPGDLVLEGVSLPATLREDVERLLPPGITKPGGAASTRLMRVLTPDAFADSYRLIVSDGLEVDDLETRTGEHGPGSGLDRVPRISGKVVLRGTLGPPVLMTDGADPIRNAPGNAETFSRTWGTNSVSTSTAKTLSANSTIGPTVSVSFLDDSAPAVLATAGLQLGAQVQRAERRGKLAGHALDVKSKTTADRRLYRIPVTLCLETDFSNGPVTGPTRVGDRPAYVYAWVTDDEAAALGYPGARASAPPKTTVAPPRLVGDWMPMPNAHVPEFDTGGGKLRDLIQAAVRGVDETLLPVPGTRASQVQRENNRAILAAVDTARTSWRTLKSRRGLPIVLKDRKGRPTVVTVRAAVEKLKRGPATDPAATTKVETVKQGAEATTEGRDARQGVRVGAGVAAGTHLRTSAFRSLLLRLGFMGSWWRARATVGTAGVAKTTLTEVSGRRRHWTGDLLFTVTVESSSGVIRKAPALRVSRGFRATLPDLRWTGTTALWTVDRTPRIHRGPPKGPPHAPVELDGPFDVLDLDAPRDELMAAARTALAGHPELADPGTSGAAVLEQVTGQESLISLLPMMLRPKGHVVGLTSAGWFRRSKAAVRITATPYHARPYASLTSEGEATASATMWALDQVSATLTTSAETQWGAEGGFTLTTTTAPAAGSAQPAFGHAGRQRFEITGTATSLAGGVARGEVHSGPAAAVLTGMRFTITTTAKRKWFGVPTRTAQDTVVVDADASALFALPPAAARLSGQPGPPAAAPVALEPPATLHAMPLVSTPRFLSPIHTDPAELARFSDLLAHSVQTPAGRGWTDAEIRRFVRDTAHRYLPAGALKPVVDGLGNGLSSSYRTAGGATVVVTLHAETAPHHRGTHLPATRSASLLVTSSTMKASTSAVRLRRWFGLGAGYGTAVPGTRTTGGQGGVTGGWWRTRVRATSAGAGSSAHVKTVGKLVDVPVDNRYRVTVEISHGAVHHQVTGTRILVRDDLAHGVPVTSINPPPALAHRLRGLGRAWIERLPNRPPPVARVPGPGLWTLPAGTPHSVEGALTGRDGADDAPGAFYRALRAAGATETVVEELRRFPYVALMSAATRPGGVRTGTLIADRRGVVRPVMLGGFAITAAYRGNVTALDGSDQTQLDCVLDHTRDHSRAQGSGSDAEVTAVPALTVGSAGGNPLDHPQQSVLPGDFGGPEGFGSAPGDGGGGAQAHKVSNKGRSVRYLPDQLVIHIVPKRHQRTLGEKPVRGTPTRVTVAGGAVFRLYEKDAVRLGLWGWRERLGMPGALRDVPNVPAGTQLEIDRHGRLVLAPYDPTRPVRDDVTLLPSRTAAAVLVVRAGVTNSQLGKFLETYPAESVTFA